MTTPFGPILATYPNKTAYYNARPDLADGWDVAGHPGSAPLGWDLVNDSEWVLVFCGPSAMFNAMQPKGSGDVVAYERASGELHVIAENIDFSEAQSRYQA